jgi:hypothetical protein
MKSNVINIEVVRTQPKLVGTVVYLPPCQTIKPLLSAHEMDSHVENYAGKYLPAIRKRVLTAQFEIHFFGEYVTDVNVTGRASL